MPAASFCSCRGGLKLNRVEEAVVAVPFSRVGEALNLNFTAENLEVVDALGVELKVVSKFSAVN